MKTLNLEKFNLELISNLFGVCLGVECSVGGGEDG